MKCANVLAGLSKLTSLLSTSTSWSASISVNQVRSSCCAPTLIREEAIAIMDQNDDESITSPVSSTCGAGGGGAADIHHGAIINHLDSNRIQEGFETLPPIFERGLSSACSSIGISIRSEPMCINKWREKAEEEEPRR